MRSGFFKGLGLFGSQALARPMLLRSVYMRKLHMNVKLQVCEILDIRTSNGGSYSYVDTLRSKYRTTKVLELSFQGT